MTTRRNYGMTDNPNNPDSPPQDEKPQTPSEKTALKGEILPPDALKQLEGLGVDTSDPNTVLALVGIISLSFHRGPIPPASELEAYEKAIPGSAAQIMGWAEQQMNHRHSLESSQTSGNESRMSRGQWFAAGIASLSIIAAVILAWLGVGWVVPVAIVAIGVGGPSVASVIARLIPRIN